MSNKRRGPTYSTQEVDLLLDALREHLPIGPEEWDLVASEHIRTWGENCRDTTSQINLIDKYTTFNLQKHYPPTVEMLDMYF